jgi:hypothetical protein
MFLGFVVAVLPYIGIPYDVTKWIWTIIGLSIVFLLFFSQKGKLHYVPYSLEDDESTEEPIRELHVLRHEEEERPQMHIETDTVIHVALPATPEHPQEVQSAMTKMRQRRKKTNETSFSVTKASVGE